MIEGFTDELTISQIMRQSAGDPIGDVWQRLDIGIPAGVRKQFRAISVVRTRHFRHRALA